MRVNVPALAAQAALAVILLSPVRNYIGPQEKVKEAKNDQDSFPLSTYPMFSADRKGRITIPHVVGLTASGERVLPHHAHFGAGGLNQVRRQISKALREGRGVDVAQKYADSLAVSRDQDRESQIVEVLVVRSRFVFAEYFAGDPRPQAESIHARCRVGGVAAAGPARALPHYTPTPKSRKTHHATAPSRTSARGTATGRPADPPRRDPVGRRTVLSDQPRVPTTHVP